MDVLYLVLFFIIIAPLSYGFIIAPVPPSEIYPGIALEVDNYLGLSVQTFLQGLSVVILTVTITVHTLISKIKGIKKA